MGRPATGHVERGPRLDGMAGLRTLEREPALEHDAVVHPNARALRPGSEGRPGRDDGIHVGDLAEDGEAHDGVPGADGAELGGREMHGVDGFPGGRP